MSRRALGQGREERLRQQLVAAQQITHTGSWEWELATNAVTWSDELYRIYGLEPQSREINLEGFLSRLHPDDRGRIRREVGRALERGEPFAYEERIVRPDGSVRHLDTVGDVLRNESGEVIGLLGSCRDVTDERRRDETIHRYAKLQAAEQRILEMIATGVQLEEVLTRLILAIEEQAPPTIGSVLFLDQEQARVRHGAAPGLPEAYNRAIDGLPIGPRAGSCGTAAFHKRQVLVSDIEHDPLWDGYRHLALPFGLRACWSTPIFSRDGRVLGTFALYYREPRTPSAEELELIARATHVAGIAIERRELDDQLRALSAHIENVREEERTAIAREIHDELGQVLTALKMDIFWLKRRNSEDKLGNRVAIADKLDAMSELTDGIIEQVRRISAAMRPGVLDDLGLAAAIEWQMQEFEGRTGIACAMDGDIHSAALNRELSTALFRILQEALTNVARHAQAAHVEVRLAHEHGQLTLEVRDDGVGISAEASRRKRSLGLLGMQERVRRFQGTLEVQAAEPKGTLVRVQIPLAMGAAT